MNDIIVQAEPNCNNYLKIICKFVVFSYTLAVPITLKENMKPQELINHFGSPTKAAAAIDVTTQTILNWIEKGVIPMNAQKAIAFDTKGKLKPDVIGKEM